LIVARDASGVEARNSPASEKISARLLALPAFFALIYCLQAVCRAHTARGGALF
jgi:hypothetical protein